MCSGKQKDMGKVSYCIQLGEKIVHDIKFQHLQDQVFPQDCRLLERDLHAHVGDTMRLAGLSG